MWIRLSPTSLGDTIRPRSPHHERVLSLIERLTDAGNGSVSVPDLNQADPSAYEHIYSLNRAGFIEMAAVGCPTLACDWEHCL